MALKHVAAVAAAYAVFIGGGMVLEGYDSPKAPQVPPVVQVEEDSPFWQCARQGNFLCG